MRRSATRPGLGLLAVCALLLVPAASARADAVTDWNRLYGPRGLVQYQLVVPDTARDVLIDAVPRIRLRRLPARGARRPAQHPGVRA